MIATFQAHICKFYKPPYDLDVFEEEPLHKSSPLWDMRNVIITPHNSFVSDGNHARMLDVIMNNLERTAT